MFDNRTWWEMKPWIWTALGVMAAAAWSVEATNAGLPDSCTSPIYCYGRLLHCVQLAGLTQDSKSFVDMHVSGSVDETLSAFDEFLRRTGNRPSRNDLAEFVDKHFEKANELETWTPPDFVAEPAFLGHVLDERLRQFARDVVAVWPSLGRKVKPDVAAHPDRYSLYAVPNGFLVPGGRFLELYYWDTFWILEGLIASEMVQTARGVIDNLLYLVKKLGHVPNGSRVYYEQRSQPPLLTGMARQYFKASDDRVWLRGNLPTLEVELRFWLDKRALSVVHGGRTYRLLHYYAPSTGPRPESYREDYMIAQTIPEGRRQGLYEDIKSAAETGWDFSSRWFIAADGSDAGNLTNVHTRRIVPVDLNSFFAEALETVGGFHNKLHNRAEAKRWWKLAKEWREAIDEVLWSAEDGLWYDYDHERRAHRKYFYPSNLAPLWSHAVELPLVPVKVPLVLRALERSGALDYPGGVPTSVQRTGEQWDLPNAWPPLQSIVVNGLYETGDVRAQAVALRLAQKWVSANLQGFTKTGVMFEKYDANTPGLVGGGGEYPVQAGFGWTNGVLLDFLDRYGELLTSEDAS